MGSENWARATASAFDLLPKKECAEVAKPEWWNDEGLKALSARVVWAAPNNQGVICMRAIVLGGQCGGLEPGPRSAAELTEAATHCERAAVMHPAPALKAQLFGLADWCRSEAEAM